MISPVVQNVLQQINSLPRAEEIKRLLLLKLESEYSDRRCVQLGKFEPYVGSPEEVIELE